MTTPRDHTAEKDALRAELGSLLDRLLTEHWPNSAVNPWYLADLLREHGVRVTPPTEGRGGGDR